MNLWIEEPASTVWHLAAGRVAPLRYAAVCGWMLHARATRVWPQKTDETGPRQAQRCHTCIGGQQIL